MQRLPIELGVNIDHVATLRQARGTRYPDPVLAAQIAELGGADGITLHLREDRRHIQDEDLVRVQAAVNTKVNLEMAVTEAMLRVAERARPEDCCLVPERREELTTEGGLDVAGQRARVAEACQRLAEAGIRVSLFIDPEPEQVDAAVACRAPVIELHTGAYAEARGDARSAELARLLKAAERGTGQGLIINAGHGLHYHNVASIAAIPMVRELNIGHAIIARSVFCGLESAVATMKRLLVEARLAA